MRTVLRRSTSLFARSATAATLVVGLAVVRPVFTSATSAQGAKDAVTDCSATVTGPPTSPASVSAESTPYGRVLMVGSGDRANPNLIGMVSRTDLPFGGPVHQVTYAGLRLYKPLS